MNEKTWIGLGLLIPLLIFFVYAYIKGGALNRNQHNILRLLSMLVGGFAGALVVGEALFSYTGTLAGGKLTLQGAGGAAFAFLVWMTFPKWHPNSEDTVFPPSVKALNLDVPDGVSFEDILNTWTGSIGYNYTLVGFTAEQKRTLLRGQSIKGKDRCDIVIKLGMLAKTAFPKYTVTEDNHVLTIKI